MIGSSVLFVFAFALASPQPHPAPRPYAHVPRIEIEEPEEDELVAMGERDDEDDEADEARDTRTRDRERRQRDAETRDRDRRRHRFDWDRDRWDRSRGDRDDDDGEPSARAIASHGSAVLPTKGPVTFRLSVQSGEVEVVAADKPQIALSVSGGRAKDVVQLVQYGDRVEAQFGEHRHLRRGHLRLELPKGSSVDFNSTSGDITVQNVGGDVRVRTMSGDVKVSGARKADLETVSGDVTVEATGPSVRLHTVSGNAVARTTDPAVQLEFESASGDLDWTGPCARGCHLSTETVSGEVQLQPDPAKSSFELSYSSHSGDFRDHLNLQMKRTRKRKHGGMGGWVEAVFGKGEGAIECDAFSGDLTVRKKQ